MRLVLPKTFSVRDTFLTLQELLDLVHKGNKPNKYDVPECKVIACKKKSPSEALNLMSVQNFSKTFMPSLGIVRFSGDLSRDRAVVVEGFPYMSRTWRMYSLDIHENTLVNIGPKTGAIVDRIINTVAWDTQICDSNMNIRVDDNGDLPDQINARSVMMHKTFYDRKLHCVVTMKDYEEQKLINGEYKKAWTKFSSGIGSIDHDDSVVNKQHTQWKKLLPDTVMDFTKTFPVFDFDLMIMTSS